MLIDPFTIIAQIVNFAILVVALKFVLYDRIIDAMDAREEAIAERLREAEEREEEAADAREDHREKLSEIERRREELVDEARADANERRRELLESAKADIDEQRRRWHQALHREQHDLERDLRSRTAEVAVSISRQVLADLADADLHRRSVELAFDRLTADDAFADFVEARQGTSVTVRTAFEGDSVHDLVRTRLADHGFDDELLSFETDPTLLIGLEFISPTESIEWHAADYLERLGNVVAELLDEHRPGDREDDDSESDVADEHTDDGDDD